MQVTIECLAATGRMSHPPERDQVIAVPEVSAWPNGPRRPLGSRGVAHLTWDNLAWGSLARDDLVRGNLTQRDLAWEALAPDRRNPARGLVETHGELSTACGRGVRGETAGQELDDSHSGLRRWCTHAGGMLANTFSEPIP